MFDIFDMLKKDEKKAEMKQVTRETIIGDILDMDPEHCSLLHGDRHALPGLPGIPRREHRGGL